MRKVIYSIEGNIGSGKSTLLKALMQSMHEVTTIPQPVDSWQHVGQYNLLDKYYENPQRWGYTFQINCILSRMNQLSKSIQFMQPHKVYISQRSVQSDKFIFAKLMHRLKKMNDMEYYLYLEMFKSLQGLFNKHAFSESTFNKKVHLTNTKSYVQLQTHEQNRAQQRNPFQIEYKHIYLKTSAEKCFERIKKRNRVEERNLEFGYIKELDNLHDEWLVDGMEKKKDSLVLDGQREFETDKNYMNELINRIKSYIIESSPESFNIDRKSTINNNSNIQRNHLSAQARNIYSK